VNVGRETHQGANFTIRTTPIWGVTFDANYTFLNRAVIGNPGVFPVGTPKHKTVGTVTVWAQLRDLRLNHRILQAAGFQSGGFFGLYPVSCCKSSIVNQ